MNILITGSKGFIGTHLKERLKDQYNIFELDRKLGQDINEMYAEDLMDLFENKFDTVFHFAANSDISTGDPIIEFNDTLKTTYRILDYCRSYGVKKFVFASSSAIYGNTKELIKEDYGPLLPISHYGAAKLASEAFISSFCDNYGIQAWICRFPNVIGGSATHGVIYDFIKKIKANPNRLEVLGNGEQIKPYIHVSELLDAILFIWKHANDPINLYNISGIGRTTVKDIAQMVVEKAGNMAKIVYSGGTSGWVGDCPEYRYNIEKLLRLGWKPSINSDFAIEKAINEIWDEL